MADPKITFILSAIDRGASRTAAKVSHAIGGVDGASTRARRGLKAFGGALVTLGKVGALAAVTAVIALTAAMGNAVKGALDEEKGIARLNAALKANVKGWDGNTASIEAAIEKRMRLAFTDDDLRQSLGTLVTGLGDVDKALAQQSLAMDIARLKNISLDDASKLLIRAQNGNTRALKELGIQIPKTASATEILAAIQKKAGGQAEAYGNTTAGAFEKFQIAMGELLEDVAVVALPVLTKLAVFLSDHVIPAVAGVIANVRTWVAENRPLVDGIAKFAGGTLKTLVTAIGNVIGFIAMLITKVTSNRDAMNALRTVVDVVARTFDIVSTAVGKVLGFLGRLIDGVTKNRAVMAGFRGVLDGVAGAFRFVRDAIGWTIDKIAALIRWVRDAINWLRELLTLQHRTGASQTGGAGPRGALHRQHGGPLRAGQSAIVGESGPELFTPMTSGTVISNKALGQASGGGTNVIQLVVDGRVLAEVVDRHNYYRFQRAAATAARS